MTFREKGGFMKYLFYVESKVVCAPKDIESLQHGLSPDEYDRLCRYVKTRDVSDFGFGSNSAYIFSCKGYMSKDRIIMQKNK